MKTSMRFFILLVSFFSITGYGRLNNPKVGDVIDSFNGVHIYYNGKAFTKTYGRNLTVDGYNLGLKYQCVEFVKRYYYEIYNHKMTHAGGNAKEFFDKQLKDKAYNSKRGLMQYRNTREYPPKVGDLLIYDAYFGNAYGHVAIISKVEKDSVEIVQQNMGLKTREKLPLVEFMGYYTVADYYVLGWLRKE